MSPRDRRLLSDLRHMEELAERGGLTFRSQGAPPDVYDVMFEGDGLARDEQGGLSLRSVHRCTTYLHLDYPRRPPVVTWLTPVFHPNILGPERNGGVCLGSWSAAESLADLCARLRELIAFRAFNTADALDSEAASWIERNHVQPGTDVRTLASLPLSSPLVEKVGA